MQAVFSFGNMDKEKLIDMLKGSSKVVGSKQVLKGLSEGTIRCVIVASDADADLKKSLCAAANKHRVPVSYVSSKKKLGEAAGVEVAAAAVGLTSVEADI